MTQTQSLELKFTFVLRIKYFAMNRKSNQKIVTMRTKKSNRMNVIRWKQFVWIVTQPYHSMRRITFKVEKWRKKLVDPKSLLKRKSWKRQVCARFAVDCMSVWNTICSFMKYRNSNVITVAGNSNTKVIYSLMYASTQMTGMFQSFCFEHFVQSFVPDDINVLTVPTNSRTELNIWDIWKFIP